LLSGGTRFEPLDSGLRWATVLSESSAACFAGEQACEVAGLADEQLRAAAAAAAERLAESGCLLGVTLGVEVGEAERVAAEPGSLRSVMNTIATRSLMVVSRVGVTRLFGLALGKTSSEAFPAFPICDLQNRGAFCHIWRAVT
jgi:hypothetical protein